MHLGTLRDVAGTARTLRETLRGAGGTPTPSPPGGAPARPAPLCDLGSPSPRGAERWTNATSRPRERSGRSASGRRPGRGHALTGEGWRVTVKERARAHDGPKVAHALAAPDRKRDRMHRRPQVRRSDTVTRRARQPGNRDGGAARRIAAHRSGRSGRRPRHRHGPDQRRRAAQARWSTTRPDDQRPPGRHSRREVTPLDAATEDGSFPPIPEASGPSANPTQSGARAGARRRGRRSAGHRTGCS